MFNFCSHHISSKLSPASNSSKRSDKKNKRNITLAETKEAPSGGGGSSSDKDSGKTRIGCFIAGRGDKRNMICLNRGYRNQVDAIYDGKLQVERAKGGKSCNSYKYKNLFTAKTTSLVFIAVCYLIMANIRCDQVGSTNDIMSLLEPLQAEVVGNQQEQHHQQLKKETLEVVEGINKQGIDDTNSLGTSTSKSDEANGATLGKKEPFDPMSFLREIYLDKNIQKFHPNGRYGRRSVGGTAPSREHMEFGKLRFIDNRNTNIGNNKPLTSLLYNLINNKSSSPTTLDDQQLLSSQGINRRSSEFMSARNSIEDLEHLVRPTRRNSGPLGDVKDADMETELSKILKCSFTGLSYLYWCNGAA